MPRIVSLSPAHSHSADGSPVAQNGRDRKRRLGDRCSILYHPVELTDVVSQGEFGSVLEADSCPSDVVEQNHVAARVDHRDAGIDAAQDVGQLLAALVQRIEQLLSIGYLFLSHVHTLSVVTRLSTAYHTCGNSSGEH